MTENKAGGILLLIIGVVITMIWIIVYGFHVYDRWYTFNIIHAKYICTFWEHFWAVGKFQMALAILAGAVPGIAGICFLLKKDA